MGSGSIFSLVPNGSSVSVEASDIWLEARVCGRVEEGQRSEMCLKALFMCELRLECEL